MCNKCIALLLVGIGCLNSLSGFSQTSRTDPNDFGTWYAVGVGVDLPKKWAMEFDFQNRYQNNASDYKGTYISVSPSKQFGKHLTVLAEYRIAFVTDATYHRYTLGAEYKWKFSKFSLATRLLVQNQLQDFDDETTDTDAFVRFRVKGQYAFSKKWSAYASIEPIGKIGGSYLLDNWRNQIGIKYKWNKLISTEAFYLYRPDYAKSYNRSFQIVGVSLNVDLKWKKATTVQK